MIANIHGSWVSYIQMYNQLPDVVSSRIGCCITLYFMVEVASVVESRDVGEELLENMDYVICNIG